MHFTCWRLRFEALSLVCEGLPNVFRELLETDHGHQWFALATEPATNLMVCARCGAYASTRPGDVASSACTGRPTDAGRTTFRQLKRGQHPNTKLEVRLAKGQGTCFQADELAERAGFARPSRVGRGLLPASEEGGGFTLALDLSLPAEEVMRQASALVLDAGGTAEEASEAADAARTAALRQRLE